MINLNPMRVQFETDDGTAEGALLGFVSVPFEEAQLSPGFVKVNVQQGGVWDGKNYIGGVVEKATIYAMIGCDTGEIQRIPFYKIRYKAPTAKPSACIGWPTIRRLAKEGHVEFEDLSLYAASDLFGQNLDEIPDRDRQEKR